MRALSLFSGIGGDTLAAKAAGIETVAFCEKDIFCQKVLARHWPDVPIFTDVYELRGDQFEGIDIVYGGFPCQPFSVAGKQKGKADARHLWPEVARLVREIKPRWCFFENVPGILNIAADDVCADLERLGYEVGVWNFEAAAVGANHRRARIAFIAHLEHPGIDMLQGVGEQGYSGAESKRRKTFESLRTGCTSTFVAHHKSGLESEFTQRDHREEQQRNEEIRCGIGTSGGDNERHATTGDRYCRGVTETFSSVVAHSGHELRERNANERERRETNAGGEAVASTHASSTPGFIPDSATIHVQGQHHGQRQGQFGGGSGRSTEPRLGRGFDGVPETLDKIGGLTNGAKKRAREILSNMWDSDLSEKVWSNFRRFHGVYEEEVLLAFLCEYEENSDCFCSTQKSDCLSGEILRNLWREVEAARASHRRQYRKQYAREYSNALHSLSQHLPSLMPQAWRSGCWEDDIPRVGKGIPDRVNRLKALGNAVVPAWAYPIFKSIVESDKEECKWVK